MKKLIILLMVMLPLVVFAQDMKIAHVDFEGILMALPEISNYEKKMADLGEQYEKELKGMQDEYTKKYEDFIANQETLTENIKLRRTQEIQSIQERIENFVPVAQQEMQKRSAELIQPLQEKVRKAVQDVAEENKYSYVVDTKMFYYTGNNAIDANPLVRRKLGL
ncbi:MAG: OmpH family outer membrane protein [Tannerellaceae bacterium]|nr:OmpH family outer membrane protein [Tannerellaceae bacterium]